ncbi:hypothetical protein [Streptomyces sp. NBC_01235]|uniref:hypothetical protein n=1 Tax=Streptomyces sp. NBC_01235 TaxID=2903788 RepID=UPI002E11AE3A|nr:hypothetical protein OG289_08780 [Streptomyces sp. NBC_01235]
MTGIRATECWERLPQEVREQADGLVLRDAVFQSVRVVRKAGQPHGLRLPDAQLVVSERSVHHGDRIARTPDDPLDLDSLTARAAGVPGCVVAIEAVWDGDTVHDWFVILLAVAADPEGEHRPATIYRRTALRHLAGEDPGPFHPSAAVADKAGRAPAGRLSVPFRFASPHTADGEAPRWRPSRR